MYKAGAAVGRWPYLLSRKDKPPSPRDFTVQSLEERVSIAHLDSVNFIRRRNGVFGPNRFRQVFLVSSMAASVI